MSRQVKRVNISGKEDKSNKVANWSNTTNNTRYPTEKLVKDSLDDKTNEYDKVITSFAIQTYVTSTDGYTFENGNLVTIDGGRSFILDFSTLDDNGDYAIFTMTKTSSTGVAFITDSNANTLPSEIKIIKEGSTFNIYNNTTNTSVGTGSRVLITNQSSGALSISFGSKKIYHTVPLIDRIYPIGAIYLSVNSVNPSLFIGGTWTQLEDTFLLACGSTYASDGENVHTAQHGESKHLLTGAESGQKNLGTVTSTGGSHNHILWDSDTKARFLGTTSDGSGITRSSIKPGTSTAVSNFLKSANSVERYTHTGNTSLSVSTTISASNATTAHNNMPPYMAVYMWKRTA